MQRFVIVVDTQVDFMHADGALAVSGAAALEPAMRAWLGCLDPADTAGVLFTFDTHDADTYPASAEARQFPIHCVRATPGWANVLDPAVIDRAIPAFRAEKGVFDLWAEPDVAIEALADGGRTPRDTFFAALKAKGIDTVTVIGVAADYRVRWAIDGLVARGFAVEVPAHLTRGIARPIDAVIRDDFAGAPVRLAV